MCTNIKPITDRLTIQPVQNGFLVYINDYNAPGTARPVPYVFETMENLLKFIDKELSSNE
jgi:hypothetical protein